VTHYLNGAWYPEGGSETIADAAGSVIRDAGGEILVNHEVRLSASIWTRFRISPVGANSNRSQSMTL